MRAVILFLSAILIVSCEDASTTNTFAFEEATVTELQVKMQAGELTAVALTTAYIDRIKELDQSEGEFIVLLKLIPMPSLLRLSLTPREHQERFVARFTEFR